MLVNVNSLPALGYDTIYFNLEKETAEQEPTQSTMTKIENEFYEIQLAANNSLTIHDKKRAEPIQIKCFCGKWR